MLDTARHTDLTVCQRTGRIVGKDPSETQRRRERPFGRVGTVGAVGCKDQVGHELLGMVVMQGQVPVGAIPGMALTVADLALHIIIGVGGKVVAVVEAGRIFETGLDGSDTPLGVHPVIELELVLHRTHHRFAHDAACIIVVPAVLVTLRAVLDGVGGVVIGAAHIELQSLEDEVQVLFQGHVRPDLALMGLGETRTRSLGDQVEVTVRLAAAPYATLGLDGECQRRHLVQMPPRVVGTQVGNTVGLHEDGQDVRLDPGRRGNLEIHVGADIRLGILELGIPGALVGILVESAGVCIVQQRVIFHFVRTAVHRDESVRLACGILEDFVLPVDVGIDEGIGAVRKFLQFGIRIGDVVAIVQPGDVQGLGIVVCTHHIGHLRVELDFVRSAGLEMEAAVGLAALGLDQEHAVDAFVSVHGHSGGVPEDGHTFHLFHHNTVDRAFQSIHKDEDGCLTGRLYATDIEGGAPLLFALETGILDSGKAEQFAIKGIGEADR